MTAGTISAQEAQRLLASGKAMLIDVREPDEFRDAHIPCAMSVPLGEVPAMLGRMDLPHDATIIFQCQKGTRGGQACTIAPAVLSDRVRNLAGGIEAWRAAGLPVTAGAASGVSIFRQVQMVVGLLVLGLTAIGLLGFRPGFYLAGLFGFMLAFAGFSGWCGLALLLRQMPWNRTASA